MAGDGAHTERGWRLFVVRVILAILGLLAVLVGLRNAWHSHATAAPSILGGVLIALALLLDPSLSEISGRYRDAEFKVVRGSFLNAAHLIRTGAGLVTDAETKLQLEVIAREVERQPLSRARKGTALQSLARRFQRLILSDDPVSAEEPFAYDEVEDEEAEEAWFKEYRDHYDWAKGVTDWGVPTPYYQVIIEARPDEPLLRRINASPSWWGDWRVEVHVRDPLGRTSAAIFRGTTGMQQYRYNVNWPDSFPDAPPIEHPGEYVFTWRRVDENHTVLARDTIVVTDEMVDPAVLETWPEDAPGYRTRVWGGEPPRPEDEQREAERRLDVKRAVNLS